MPYSTAENPLELDGEFTLIETIGIELVDPDGNLMTSQETPIHVRPDGSRFVRLTVTVHGGGNTSQEALRAMLNHH